MIAVTVAGVLFVLTSVLPARAAEGEPPESARSPAFTAGRQVFESKGCARCHSVFGNENDEERAGPDLGRHGSWADVMQFAAALWNHSPAMSDKMAGRHLERQSISPQEMGMLVTYLFQVKFFDQAGDVSDGAELFESRRCAACHQLRGRGGTLGPRLDELHEHVSSFFMAQAMWNHGPEMAAAMKERGLAWPRLEAGDVPDLVAFIRGESRPPGSLESAYAAAGSPARGNLLFRERGCVSCHAIAGSGGTVGPDLAIDGEARRRVGQVAAALWNHGPAMWAKMKEEGVPFPRLSERDASDLIAYLHYVQYMGATGNATRGRDLFRTKGCAYCHALGGTTAVGPDLFASKAVQSPAHWASAMWNHAPAMKEKAAQEQIAWPRFEGDEMRDLVAFLRAGDTRGEGKR